MDRPWEIELLGWLRVVQTDRVITRFRTRKAEALLAYLAYFRHRSHPREQLIELLQPEGVPSAGLRRLSVELTVLRHQLEPPGVPPGAVLVATRTTIQLNPEACVTDVACFEAVLEAAKQAANPTKRAEQLAAAARFYRGELLPGFFDEWILPERQRLAEAHLQALHELVGLLEELGDMPGALQWARRAVAADPLGEESHQRLIRLLLAGGQIEAAREQYEQAEHRLLQELGAGFSPEVRSLIREVAPAKDRPPSAPARERGKRRRLAGPRPERLPPGPVTSLWIDEYAERGLPLDPAGPVARPSDNLPLRFTRFFGREVEIAHLMELLGASDTRWGGDQPAIQNPKTKNQNRLITLTGPGGSGKTRLSLQAAQELRGVFPGGVWFVSLRELSGPALIPAQILLALRLPRSAQREALEQVVSFLSSAPCLLLLDNYEHLVERGAETVQRLLEQVEHLAVLVTSRQRLGLEGEREFPVAPLPVPVESFELRVESSGKVKGPVSSDLPTLDAQSSTAVELSTLNSQLSTLSQCPSVALFVDRAQAVRPDFQVTSHNAAAVAAVCQRLEGLPLAIELAAARSGVLTPQQILSRLEQRFEVLVGRQRTADPRHRSLRATLDWSYQLLTPELQRFFARLSIFRGGWTVEAAAAVCDFGSWILDFGLPEKSKAPEDRASLSDAAPPTTPEGRTPLSDPIQNPKSKIQNTLDSLEQLREASLVQAAETGRGTAERSEVVMRFHLLETLREFGAEQLTREDQDALSRRHAHFFLALAETAESELTRADQVLWLDRLDQELDNLRAALTWCAESGVQVFRDSGVQEREGSAPEHLNTRTPEHPSPVELGLRLGSALERFWQTRGHMKEGRTQLLRLLAAPGAAAPTAARARALSTAGLLTWLQDDVKRARALLEESLALWRRLEDQAGIAAALLHLGWFESAQVEYASALRRAEECLAIRRELGEPSGLADALELTAKVRGVAGDPQARGLLEESIAIWQTQGDRISATRGRASLAERAECEGDMETARRLYEEVLVAATELGDRPRVAWALVGLGVVAQVQEDYPTARAFYERTLPLWQELDDKWGFILTRFYLGTTLMRQGEAAAAYERFAEILPIAREGNRRLGVAETLAFLGWAAGDLGRWEETAARCAESLELCSAGETWGRRIGIEWGLFGLARVALVRGNPARAARLLGATEAVWDGRTDGPPTPARRRELDQAAAAIRARRGPSEFEAAWSAGRALPLDQAIALALQEVSAG